MFITTFGHKFKRPGEFTDDTVTELLEKTCQKFPRNTASRNMEVVDWTADDPTDYAKDYTRRSNYPLLASGAVLLMHKVESEGGWSRMYHLFEVREREDDLYDLDSPHGWVETFIHLPGDHRERARKYGEERREQQRQERRERQRNSM